MPITLPLLMSAPLMLIPRCRCHFGMKKPCIKLTHTPTVFQISFLGRTGLIGFLCGEWLTGQLKRAFSVARSVSIETPTAPLRRVSLELQVALASVLTIRGAGLVSSRMSSFIPNAGSLEGRLGTGAIYMFINLAMVVKLQAV